MKASNVVIFVVLIFMALKCIASSEADLKSSAEKTYNEIRFLRSTIEKSGSKDAQKVDKTVNFIVDESSLVPYASSSAKQNGLSAKIRFSAQYRLILAYLTEMLTLVNTNDDFRRCDERYDTYLFERMALNARRAFEEKPALDTEAPEIFAARIGGVCSEIPSRFPLSSIDYPQLAPQVYFAIAFVYLHELGHLVLGHKAIGDEIFAGINSEAGKMKVFLAANARSQKQELEADAWATREMIKMGASTEQLVSIPLLRMLLASSGLDCQLSEANSHPTATRRFTEIINTIKSSGVPMRKELSDLYDEFLLYNKKVEQALKCN